MLFTSEPEVGLSRHLLKVKSDAWLKRSSKLPQLGQPCVQSVKVELSRYFSMKGFASAPSSALPGGSKSAGGRAQEALAERQDGPGCLPFLALRLALPDLLAVFRDRHGLVALLAFVPFAFFGAVEPSRPRHWREAARPSRSGRGRRPWARDGVG